MSNWKSYWHWSLDLYSFWTFSQRVLTPAVLQCRHLQTLATSGGVLWPKTYIKDPVAGHLFSRLEDLASLWRRACHLPTSAFQLQTAAMSMLSRSLLRASKYKVAKKTVKGFISKTFFDKWRVFLFPIWFFTQIQHAPPAPQDFPLPSNYLQRSLLQQNHRF